MQSAPLPENEASRLSDLHQYQVLDTPPEEASEEVTALAAQICGTPIALVSLVDTHRQWFKAKVGIEAQETSRDMAFCAHAIHVLVQPAVIGWEAKKRRVDLTIERSFKGDELVMRMKGWVTTDVKEVVDVVKNHGFLKVLDDRELVVELETQKDFDNLSRDLETKFGDQVNIDRV